MGKNHEKKDQQEKNHLQPGWKRSHQKSPQLNKVVIGVIRKRRQLSGDAYHDSLYQQRHSRNR